ncbi:cytochrome P450 [Lentinula raphanica]|nr:cytochrome P450 [Lentinula raphanica]
MALQLYLCAVFGLASLFVARWKMSKKFRTSRPPPGPSGWPLIGYISILWERKPWLRFTEWNDVYGPVVQLKVFGKTIVVLNTHKAAFDLLCQRKNVYNGRPPSILISDMLTGGLAFPLVNYGDLWKRHRRAATFVLNPRAVEQYHGYQEHYAEQLARSLLKDPAAWSEAIKGSLYGLFCSIGYGEATKDRAAHSIRDFIGRIVFAAIPGSSITDFFPFIARLPSSVSPLKRRHLAQFRADNKEFVGLLSKLQNDITAGDTMVSGLSGMEDMTVDERAWVIAVLCAIGGEVSSSVLPTFLLAMALYPDVQRRAQLEIDTVVGKDRFPTFQDRNKLPYVQAIVREVLRWRPIGPIGFPRASLQDDYYNGHLIKAGSIVVPNIWAMNRDPVLYPDCDEFRPERFLDFKHDVPGALGQGHVSYGFGDRICSGMHIANDALFINIAAMLHTCDIGQPTNGTTLTKDVFEDFGVVTRPGVFPCKISARKMDL